MPKTAPHTRPLTSRTHDWWSYQRSAEYGVVGTTIDVPMRDGVTLRCELRRPARGGVAVDVPTPGLVVEFTPYVVLHDFYLGEADFFASRGYVVVAAALMRGIGGSGGRWEHGSFVQGGRDAHDLVEWLAEQAFCNGRVGMYGESFGAQTSYGAAVEQPAHLVAIAPLQSPSSLYHDVIFPGGVKSTERGEIDSWPDIANMTSNGAIDADAEYAANRHHTTFDEFWHDRSFVDRLDAVSVPVLAVGGWNDHYFRSGTLANIEALLDRTWWIYGSWGHFFPVELTGASTWTTSGGSEREEMLAANPQLPSGVLLAWFDHWLAQRPDVPIPAEPTMTSFEGPPGVGVGWCELDGWDPAFADGVTLHLIADGRLADRADGSASVSLREAPTDDGTVAALTFTTEPLVDDLVWLGHAALSFRAALDAAEANFHVEVLDIDSAGEEHFVNDGYLAATHRHSHLTPSPVSIGEFEDFEVPIRAHHHRFVTGHRIRVRVSGGVPAKLTAPPEPVTVTIETGPTATLLLPVPESA